jgi:hypothetical protein
MVKRGSHSLLLALLLFLLSSVAVASEPVVPANLQAVLFKKLFAYDRALEGKAPKVLVVHAVDGDSRALEVANAFRAVGIETVTFPLADLESHLAGASAIYAFEMNDQIASACERNKLLSISPHARLAREGRVSVALGVKPDGRPEILIHIARTRGEGHDFPASLLNLATIVQ